MGDGLPEQKRMEHFSEAYVRAIAAAAGFSVHRPEDDFDSTDLWISARGVVEYQGKRGKKRSPSLALQLKCTFKHQPTGGELHFPLKLKNYDDLRQEPDSMPRILVVVCVPEHWDERLVWSPEELRMLRCAFWTSLRGAPDVENDATVTVRLCSYLSPEELCRLMYLVSQEELR